MPFCKYSSSLINAGTINIDAKFLNDYLPIAPENCVKVYLFGLLKCQNSAGFDNTIENFENVLNMSKDDIIDCFLYWQEQNLVQVLDVDPLEVRYLPVKDNYKHLKKLDNKKYAGFVQDLEEIMHRQISMNELNRYVDFIEFQGFLPQDFNMIVKYCVDRKGGDINYNYILTVARIWAEEGIRTAEKIEQKIASLTMLTEEVTNVAKALKFKGNLSLEHQQMYEKWTKSYGFSENTILALAKKVALKTKNYSFEMLDKLLTQYFELKLMSLTEMEEYESNKADLTAIAREINKTLGIYYESVDNEINTYLLPWLNKGFNEQALFLIANFCFKNSIRTLEGMDNSIQKFSKLGLTTASSINGYLSEILEVDEEIKTVLTALNLDRRVNTYDRSFYRTWTYSYNFSRDIIDYAVSIAKGSSNTMQHVNNILTMWHEKGLKTLDEIKTSKVDNVTPTVKKDNSFVGKSFTQRSYTNEELNALFDNLDELDI